ncbi:unnamed protein product [Rotaria socialis]|uniref:Testis-expressed sequence 2 protein n=1 Tax=Rotaria socialis TaxID=392032 RepID=A0A820R5B6_9BILA|nr:unnamed protein product [Rotaria socialis]CAF3730655.1 unnamed protein product [Rotaria socialis]CAF4432131.1 unnamed protein product [Rotaria socialis]CAF4636455.1 unnamed protein product [Rotaria socialis]
MEHVRRLFAKTIAYHRLTEKPSLLTFGNFASTINMISNSPDHAKKSSVLEKLGQKITTFKEDVVDNFERRKQSQNKTIHSQIHFITHTDQSEDSLVIEKKSSAPIEIPQKTASEDECSIGERSNSTSQVTLTSAMKTTNDPSTPVKSENVFSNSFQDIFSTDNSEQAKELIINNVRNGVNRSYSGALSESGSDDSAIKKNDTVDTIVDPTVKNKRKATMLLAGPKFRYHTTEPETSFQRDTIYPVSIVVGITSIVTILWKPISPLISGFILGFLCSSAIAYIIIRIYLNAKAEEKTIYEWIDFPELESVVTEKINKIDKNKTSPTCCEIIFGRFDADLDHEFIRYPVVIRLENDHLIIQLPAKAKSEEKKEKEIKFIGYREYSIKDVKLILVPEGTLGRVKYWVNEYPIVINNVQSLDTQITNKQAYEKSKLDLDDFFNNVQSNLSIFFETCPDKEDWYYKLLFAARKNKEETEPLHRSLINASSTPQLCSPAFSPVFQSMVSSPSDTQIQTLGTRTSSKQSNLNNVENRARKKSIESTGSSNLDTTSLEKFQTEPLRSQINDADVSSDMTQAGIGVQELRADILEKDKKSNDKDSDKDSTGTQQRTGSIKKKSRKQEENLLRILSSPDCLNEAALTLNFLVRRLFCDVFQESFFKDLLKEKLELKLKELAVSVLHDLRIETIDIGNTFPVILKVEPMQWNPKGLWINLFVCYRGSFKVTIRTRIVLQTLFSTNASAAEQPIRYQHYSGQLVPNDDEQRVDNEDSISRQRQSNKDPDIFENAAARKLGSILSKVAGNKHFQRFAALKPVAGVIEKLSNADVGANIELTNLNGIMTINIPPPPSDRIWIGFSEMPDLNLKVTPVFGESKYSYTIIHDYLESQIRDEIKRVLVLPAMDDQLLPFFRDWVLDMMSDLSTISSNKNLNPADGAEC